MLPENSNEGLEEKRKSQKTRELVEVQTTDNEDPLEVENVQLIHDGVEGWTLFEKVDGTQIRVQDKFLVYYKDPEGAA